MEAERPKIVVAEPKSRLKELFLRASFDKMEDLSVLLYTTDRGLLCLLLETLLALGKNGGICCQFVVIVDMRTEDW